MTTTEPLTSTETLWDQQRKTLSRVRDKSLKNGGTVSQNSNNNARRGNGYSPLDDTHPLLQRSRASPTSQLPRLSTPPEHRKYQHSPGLRGAKYQRVPPVSHDKPQYDDRPERFGSPAEYDSWGEGGESDSGEYPPTMNYPLVMYPMVYQPGQHSPKKKRTKPGDKKKRVRYRNTPTYLNSREHTLHSPPPLSAQHPQSSSYESYPRTRASYHNDSQFSYLQPSYSYDTGERYNPFDPRMNPVVAQYLPGMESDYPTSYRPPVSTVWQTPRRHKPAGKPTLVESTNHFHSNWLFATRLSEDFIVDTMMDELGRAVVKEVLSEASSRQPIATDVVRKPPPRPPLPPTQSPSLEYNSDDGYILRNDPIEEFLNGLLEDVVIEESVKYVKESVHQLVDEHLARAAMYDIMGDLFEEILKEEAPKVVDEAMTECLFEEIIDELIVGPATDDTIKEVAVETLDKYNDQKRRRQIKEVRALTGDKVVDSMCLDYLLALTARQGKIFTQGEHANKLFDSMLLNVLLHEYQDVNSKRKYTVDNKAIRRMHEKMTTDVASDVALEELSRCLDQDMMDLDEYEHGYMDNLQELNPSDLQKWLAGT